MNWPLILILLILAVAAIFTTRRDDRLERLREKYTAFKKILPEKYAAIKNKNTIITGTTRKGSPGENVNKGDEIIVCMDGNDDNALFHILIHEIAHSSVNEYDHSSDYWENYKELTELAAQAGLYVPGVDKEYCGKRVRDGYSTLQETGEGNKTEQQ